MYCILIETEEISQPWIDTMDDNPANQSSLRNSDDSSQSVLRASSSNTHASTPSTSSNLVSYHSQDSLRSSSGLPSPSFSRNSSQPISNSNGASSSTNAEEKKKPTFNVLDTMAPISILPQLPKKLAFTSGNPTIETTKGIIHLYNEHPSLTSNHSPVSSSNYLQKSSKIVCIVAVPTWLAISDLSDYIGDEFVSKMEGLRVLADSSPNKYMVVMKFRTQTDALEFVKEFNGKPFSSMSETGTPEICLCAFVKYVDFVKPTGKSKQESIASSSLFPYSSIAGPNLVEIPTCPVCLERLDSSVSGLLTILCQHTFHCNCLTQWKEDNTCPICRYIQQPSGHDSSCAKCGTHDQLWICLLCGHVGCSRYQESHAHMHYKETLHNYALELSSQRVWDYAGDGYVHRLIQNKSDGKLVELPSPHANSNARPESAMDDKEELQKVDAISLEYQYLLTAQLETQRAWFEQKMREHEEIRSRHIRELEQQTKNLKDQLSKAQSRAKQLELEHDAQLTKQLDQERLIKDLEEQIRDLMVNLDARTIISKEGELADGQVVMLANPDAKIAAASSSSSLPSNPTRDALRRKLARRKKDK